MTDEHRLMDREVAVKVMGQYVVAREIDYGTVTDDSGPRRVRCTEYVLTDDTGAPIYAPGPLMHGYGMVEVPHYSTDLASAWKVADRWDGDYDIRRQNGCYRVTLYKPSEQWEAWAATLPEAICRAALAAAGELEGEPG